MAENGSSRSSNIPQEGQLLEQGSDVDPLGAHIQRQGDGSGYGYGAPGISAQNQSSDFSLGCHLGGAGALKVDASNTGALPHAAGLGVQGPFSTILRGVGSGCNYDGHPPKDIKVGVVASGHQ